MSESFEARARYLGADAAMTAVVDHYMMSAHEARAFLSPDADGDGFEPPDLSGQWAEAIVASYRKAAGL